MNKGLCLFSLLATLPVVTAAAPISVADRGSRFEIYHFRTGSGTNSAGFFPGEVLTFGLTNVVPNGYGENAGVPILDANGNPVPATTGVARQNGVVRSFEFDGNVNTPNQYSGGVIYNAALTGSWEIELTNGTDKLTVYTPEVGAVRLPDRPTDVKLSTGGDPVTPTFTWTNTDLDADSVRLTVFDPLLRDLAGRATAIYYSPDIDNSESSFTIPENVLKQDGLYTIRLESRILRNSGEVGPSGQSLVGSNLSVNRTWFDFTTGDTGIEGEIFLPEVSYDENDAPIFNFDNLVRAGVVEYYDPLVAIGYDYAIGEGNPNFGSVILPAIGDSLFGLFLPNGSEFDFIAELFAGKEYVFSDDGVSSFRILGIEPSAGLNPEDPAAFVTGLSFVSDGRFTGTMTPITEFVAPVPLPHAFVLMIGSFGLLGWVARRRKQVVLAGSSVGSAFN